MTGKEFELRMEDEIRKRINSQEWDSKIATNVTKLHKRRIKKNIFVVSLSSLAATVVFVFLLFLNPGNQSPDKYEKFIQAQIEGTYSEVFNENYLQNRSNNSDDIIVYDNIDLLIDSALSRR